MNTLFTNTDTGVLRQCLQSAGVGTGDDTIYNDKHSTGNRRLKVSSGWSWPRTIPRATMLTLERLVKSRFGKRFIKLDKNRDGDVCLYLNDNFGGPFKPIPKPAGPRPATPRAKPYRRPRVLDCVARNNFWAEALGVNTVKYWKVYTTKHDIPVFKKVYDGTHGVDTIANLVIPAGSRVHITSGKCRADKARVVSMFRMRGDKREVPVAHSGHDYGFNYFKGKTVVPKYRFGAEGEGDCASGIHFYIDVAHALDY